MIRAEILCFGLSLWAKTGRSPNRYIAQGNTLGVSELSNLRSERAAGGSSLAILPIPFALSERKIVIPFLPRVLPWAVFPLGFQPVFARNHGFCTILCAIFPLAFSPSFFVTMVAPQSSALYFYSAFSSSFLVTTVVTQSFDLYYFLAFSLSLFVIMATAQSFALYSFWAFSPSLLVIMVAAQSSALYFCWAFTPLLQPDGWFAKNRGRLLPWREKHFCFVPVFRCKTSL